MKLTIRPLGVSTFNLHLRRLGPQNRTPVSFLIMVVLLLAGILPGAED